MLNTVLICVFYGLAAFYLVVGFRAKGTTDRNTALGFALSLAAVGTGRLLEVAVLVLVATLGLWASLYYRVLMRSRARRAQRMGQS